MKAIVVPQYGPPEVMQYKEVPIPSILPDEVLIEVKACGINYSDTTKRIGKGGYQTKLPWIPGSEVAGIVRKVGANVTEFTIGDRIMTLTQETGGGYAQYCKAKASRIFRIPDSLSFTNAAAIALQGLTAYHVLTTVGQLSRGESVLIHAAAGGVGTLAIQLSKYLGASKIIATASSEEKLEVAKSLGADVLINYSKEDWIDLVKENLDGEGVHIILESIGGQFRLDNVQLLSPFGQLIAFGQASRQSADVDPTILMKNCLSIKGFHLDCIMERKELFVESVRNVFELAKTGVLKPVIGSVQPLSRAIEIHRRLEQRQTIGKLILLPWK